MFSNYEKFELRWTKSFWLAYIGSSRIGQKQAKLLEGEEVVLHVLLLLLSLMSNPCTLCSNLQSFTTQNNNTKLVCKTLSKYCILELYNLENEMLLLHVYVYLLLTLPLWYHGYQLITVGSFSASMEYRVAVTGTTASASPLQIQEFEINLSRNQFKQKFDSWNTWYITYFIRVVWMQYRVFLYLT